jgi:cobalt-precorrin 5A hydrolase
MPSHFGDTVDWATEPVAIVALGREEAELGNYLLPHFARATLYLPLKLEYGDEASRDTVRKPCRAVRFDRIARFFEEQFRNVRGIVALAPIGVVVRSIAPYIKSKLEDPAIVVVDACGRHAVSLLSGHEGGANRLALFTSEILNAVPVITTTTEAAKRLIVGVGCRRESSADAIRESIQLALDAVSAKLDDVRLLASVEVKRNEPGLRLAAKQLNLPLRFISLQELNRFHCTESPFVRAAIAAPAVAEPAALIAGARTRCLLNKTVYRPGVTVAIAEEQLPWSGSVQEQSRIEPDELNATL